MNAAQEPPRGPYWIEAAPGGEPAAPEATVDVGVAGLGTVWELARRGHQAALEAGRIWECPCHGSRVTPDDHSLQGPEARPREERLEERED
ncbi:hypothetical protein [Streptomyces sp. NPDC058739]|uniref:hypothetical protein n=1 Tax=Streptomyces sp. NPDC058739 TaxID=3346618 RepID=UPI0036B8B446